MFLHTDESVVKCRPYKDHKGSRCYIATQHPLHETVDDLWRMVWDQQAYTVVMVNDKENEKPVREYGYLVQSIKAIEI